MRNGLGRFIRALPQADEAGQERAAARLLWAYDAQAGFKLIANLAALMVVGLAFCVGEEFYADVMVLSVAPSVMVLIDLVRTRITERAYDHAVGPTLYLAEKPVWRRPRRK